jgi:hypothetical protein
MKQATDQAAQLKRELEEARAEVARLRTPAPIPPVYLPPVPPVTAVQPVSVGRPTLDQFANEADPYQAHTIALFKYEQQQEQARQREQEQQARYQVRLASHQARIGTRASEDGAYRERAIGLVQALTAAGLPGFPDPVVHAIVSSDQSVDILDQLGTHPERAIALARRFANQPSSAPVVETLQEYLESLVPAASVTGSAGPTRQSRAAPPPKPVGSAPPAADVDEGDLPLDEFIQRFNARRRKRGRR